jgi:hypothetical protein
MYLRCPLKESRTAIIVFYVLCLLYVLSMVTFAIDLLNFALEVEVSSTNSILEIIIIQMLIGALSPKLQNGSQSMIYRVYIVPTVANGSCDFVAQCILVCLNHRVIRFTHLDL